ncbi:MAG: metal ABC transporter solute-binding protein, Zn/Mn family [Steroidobacteraceae bacterium]
MPSLRRTPWFARLVTGLLGSLAVTGCGSALAAATLRAVGVESEYADVIAQIGGRYVRVRAIETDPNTDPHSFEASPAIARQIASADLIVRNGVGYDAWVERIISAAPSGKRREIDVQRLLGLPDSTANPHLWYDPKTMPVVANAVAADLSILDPPEAAYFHANARQFEASLAPWRKAIASFKAQYGGTRVAVTEPVANYLLEAAGCDIATPFSLQTAIMNGTDPAPQDVAMEDALLRGHEVKVLVYNRQVTDTLTESFLDLARRSGIPVVGVYETLPTPGYHYQSWMRAEVMALRKAMAGNGSTETLGTGIAP